MKNKLTTAVIATIKDDPKGLNQLLADLELQSHQPTEVILVFAGLDTQSAEVLQSYADRLPLTHIVLSSQSTRSQARNAGVQMATSEVILFTDAGCHPDKHWIKELIQAFSHEGVELVSGYTGTWSQSDWELAQASFVLVPRKSIEFHPLPATRNMAILRSTFLENSGFEDELNYAEDYEFSRRLRSRGIHAQYAPKAVVSWQPRKTYFQFCIMIFRLTSGDMQSGMLRLGHVSMILRYVGFLGLYLLIWRASGLQNAVFWSVMTYLIYILAKSMSAYHLSFVQKCWYATFIPLCDGAVLFGIIFGLAGRSWARENRTA